MNNKTKHTNLGSNGDDSAPENGEEKQEPPLTIVGVTPKAVGDERRFLLDDLALLTGGTVLGREYSTPPHLATVDDLGTVIRTEYSGEHLHLVPERQHTAAVQAKATELRTRLAAMTLDDDDRKSIVERLAALSGGMGILKIGAESKVDREVRAQNAERALKVLSSAQHTGTVPGGGAAYIHAIPALDEIEATGDIALGVDVVRRALSAPLCQIVANSGLETTGVVIDNVRQFGPNGAYDVYTDTVADAYESGVLDVAGVQKIVLRTAASTAVMALSTDTIVYHKNPKQEMTP